MKFSPKRVKKIYHIEGAWIIGINLIIALENTSLLKKKGDISELCDSRFSRGKLGYEKKKGRNFAWTKNEISTRE